TRRDKHGNVYKKVGEDAWSLLESPQPQEASFLEKVQAAAAGVGKSVLLNTAPYISAGIEKGAEFVGLNPGKAQDDELRRLGVQLPKESFDEKVTAYKDMAEQVRAKAPGYALAGEMAGFLVPGAAASKI